MTRSALQNAASVAAMVLTTESLVADIPAPEPAAPAGGPAGMGGVLSRKQRENPGVLQKAISAARPFCKQIKRKNGNIASKATIQSQKEV